MTTGYVSAPLLKLLQAAAIQPGAVQRSIINRAGKNTYPVLRAGHPYIRRIRAATALDVTGIAWRYGRLLVSIEQIKNRRVHWFYEEIKSSHCSFRCSAELPETVAIALRGKPLSVVTDTIEILADVTIAGVDEEFAAKGMLSLKLAPEWIPF